MAVLKVFQTRVGGDGPAVSDIRVGVICPHCGFRNSIIAVDWSGSGITYCGGDGEGCERRFAYTYNVAWVASTFGLEVKDDAGQP